MQFMNIKALFHLNNDQGKKSLQFELSKMGLAFRCWFAVVIHIHIHAHRVWKWTWVSPWIAKKGGRRHFLLIIGNLRNLIRQYLCTTLFFVYFHFYEFFIINFLLFCDSRSVFGASFLFCWMYCIICKQSQ